MPRRAITAEERHQGQRLGQVLNDQRVAQQLTIVELADRCQVPYGTLRSLLKGRNSAPGFFLVAHVSRQLGLSPNQLADHLRNAQRRERPTADSRPSG
jgi:transcriptional regulator with XRE-family HTH domain